MPSCNIIYHNIHYAKYDTEEGAYERSSTVWPLPFCCRPWSGAATLNPEGRDPRIGYWIEEKISPTYPQAEGLQLSFEDLGGGRIRIKLGANHTPENLIQVEAKCDGGVYPEVYGTGKPVGRSYSCRVTGPRTVKSGGEAGNPKSGSYTLAETVSEDGITMTGDATYRDAAGKFVREVRRKFTRRLS